VTFPAAQATTDLAAYSGGEWPDPLAPCPGYVSWDTGLPLVVETNQPGDTAAADARLQVDGQDVPVCAYGSTQYVKADDPATQNYARNLLRGYGAVFVIPRTKLQAGKTYDAQVSVNGRLVAWQFRTAAALRPATLQDAGTRQQVR
jgi:hypothetical protein